MEITASDKFTPPQPLNMAVLFLVFNRLDPTKQVFEAISQAKPPRLYVAADGARVNKKGEADKAQVVRDYIMQNIDWKCEVKTLFREENLGCKYAVSGAITWFFENEEQGIILEDDCLPSQSFFWFCEELLEKYKDDMRVGQISGFNYGYENKDLKYDYFFSKYPMIWGWASWANRWNNYSLELEDLHEIKNNNQFTLLFGKQELVRRMNIFEEVQQHKIDTWDYQWSFTLYKNSQYTIIPKYNYILNLGFGDDSTHTSGENPYINLRLDEMKNELKHPNYIIQDIGLYKLINSTKNIFKKIFTKLMKK
jgi:hypothetical protein